MISEAIIENVARQHFNSYPEDVIVEEKTPEILQIEWLIRQASNSGKGRGFPDFIITFQKRVRAVSPNFCF